VAIADFLLKFRYRVGKRTAAQDIGYVKERYPEVTQNLGLFKFPGSRQRETAVANIRGAVELLLLLNKLRLSIFIQ